MHMWTDSYKRSSVVLALLCAHCLGRTLAWAILQKVFNILTFTVKLMSQAEHVCVQGKQTWAGSSLVM